MAVEIESLRQQLAAALAEQKRLNDALRETTERQAVTCAMSDDLIGMAQQTADLLEAGKIPVPSRDQMVRVFRNLRDVLEMAEALERQRNEAYEAVAAMAEDGWLYHGVEGLSEAQKKCYRVAMRAQTAKEQGK